MDFRAKLEKRLEAGKFRMVNEKLHKNRHMKIESSLLQTYHSGFQSQSKKWKDQPIDMVREKLRRKELILDAGCGEAILSAHFPNVIPLDLHPVNNRTVQGDICNLPLRDHSFDVVVLCLSLMMEDISAAIRESNRVLRKGGRLLVAEASSRIQDQARFVSRVERAGFSCSSSHTNSYFVLMEFSKISDSVRRFPIMLGPYTYKKR